MGPAAPDSVDRWVDHLFRRQAGQMTSTLTGIFGPGELDLIEEVVQEAFLKALRQWPYHGVPGNPGGWVIQVAKNRALDVLRRRARWNAKRDELERAVFREPAPLAEPAGFADEIRDDELRMVFMCCHPVLPRDARTALTLKMVGGFSVGEIASGFLVREKTIAQRLVRAKRRLRDESVRFQMPTHEEMPERMDSVLESIYLIFNEGHSANEGEALIRRELCSQAIRLTELLTVHPLTATPAAEALASLLLFQGSRLAARADGAGEPMLLSCQDRSLWDRGMIARGLEHFEKAARGPELTRYHLEAEIASCHALAESYEKTDWRRILETYDRLSGVAPSPVVSLNRAIALSKVDGAKAGLRALRGLESEPALVRYYPFHATCGELHLEAGRRRSAVASFREALRLSTSAPVRRFLMRRAAAAERRLS